MREYTNILQAQRTVFDNSCANWEDAASLSFLPDVISIFLFGSDFVYQHEKRPQQERVFSMDNGCYMDVNHDTPKYTGKPCFVKIPPKGIGVLDFHFKS